jgi:hypothetical protein
LYSNNSLFIAILLYILPWLHRRGEKATTNITTHHPKIHNQNRNTYQNQNISSQPITPKNLNQNKNTSKAEHFFHHHSSAKFSNSTQKERAGEREALLGVRQQTHHNYLPTKTTYLLPKTTYLPTYLPKSKMAGVELVGDK